MSNTMKTLAVAALSLTLAACGGGGGGSSSPASGTGGGTSTPVATNNGAALLAAYTPPADIAADVVTNYTGPAFNVGNSGIASNCSNPAVTSTTVVSAPDVIVFSANNASLKAQELAADQFENQAVPTVRTALGLPTTGVAFDGQNRVQICVDTALGQGIGETGTAITGQTGLGSPGAVTQLMSADSPQFDQRFPGATSLDVLVPLVTHETTHDALYSQTEPFGGTEIFFQEGLATTVAGQSIGTKASVLAAVQASDPLALNNPNTNLNAYGAYEATMQYVTSSQPGGLGFGLTNIKTFLAAYRTQAQALCGLPIPSGLTEPARLTDGMPAGTYNACGASPAGLADPRLETAFDASWNATFRDSNGTTPLYLHTGDDPTGADSLEQTLYARLNGFLPN
jgi:hypothetical protein